MMERLLLSFYLIQILLSRYGTRLLYHVVCGLNQHKRIGKEDKMNGRCWNSVPTDAKMAFSDKFFRIFAEISQKCLFISRLVIISP